MDAGINKYSEAPPVSEDGKSNNPFMEPGQEYARSQTPVEVDLHGLGEAPTSFMDSFLNDGSSSKSSNTSSVVTANDDDDDLGSGNKSYRSSTSSSSSSSSSFDENFFLMDEGEARKSNVESLSLLQLEDIRQLGVNDPHEQVSSNPVPPQPSSLPVVPVRKSARDSPPQIQVMERLEAPDPNRIPASVFARTKSTQQVEWSVQSNESLFSIHMGNNSFSRDQMFFMGRSQELGKYEDMFKYPSNATGVVNNVSTPASDSEKSKSATGSDDAVDETIKGVTTEDHNKAKPPDEVTRHSTSTSQISDDSTVSFAFPILTKNATKGKSSKLMTENEKRQSQPLPRLKSQPQQQPEPQPQPQPEPQLQSQPQQGQKQPKSRACGAKAVRTTCRYCLCCLYCR